MKPPLDEDARPRLGIPQFARFPNFSWISGKSEMVLAALFFGFLTLPGLFYLLRPDPNNALGEMRELAPKPVFDISRMEEFPEALDDYWKDHFGLRRPFIRWHSTIRYLWMGAPASQVLIGKDQWLFYYKARVLEDYLGFSEFSSKHLKAWTKYMKRRQALLERYGVKYLFVVAPNKSTVYPEMMPPYLVRRHGSSRLEQIKKHLTANGSPVHLLDLSMALHEAKTGQLVYIPGDTHWNGYGYWAAYDAMIRELRAWFDDLKRLDLGTDYVIEQRRQFQDGWNQLGLPERALDDTVPILVESSPKNAVPQRVELPEGLTDSQDKLFAARLTVNPSGRRTLLLSHDSFMTTGIANPERTPLSEHFERVISVGQVLNDTQLQKLVERFKPDVFIEETVERYLGRMPSDPARPRKMRSRPRQARAQ